MEDDTILNHVLHQIISDVEHGDLTAIDEMLKILYTEDTKKIFTEFLNR